MKAENDDDNSEFSNEDDSEEGQLSDSSHEEIMGPVRQTPFMKTHNNFLNTSMSTTNNRSNNNNKR